MEGSIQGRFDMVKVALECWRDGDFIGSGPGSFGYAMYGIDNSVYPHNLLVEALCELGPLGFICLLIVFFHVLKKILLLNRRQWRESPIFIQISILGAAALYYILLSFKTGSIYGSFLLWFYFSAFLHSSRRFMPSEFSDVQHQHLSCDSIES